MFQLTRNNVIAKLTEAMQLNGPDYKYKRGEGEYSPCQYAPDEKNPHGCLIGAMITGNGVPLREKWDKGDAVPADAVLRELVRDGLINVPSGDLPVVIRVLLAAQDAQDIGHTWGDAVEDAQLKLRILTEEGA